MKKFLLGAFFLTFYLQIVSAQTVIKGTVSDQKKDPVPGANIFLENTYDGTTSDVNGNFNFSTTENGNQILKITFVGYVDYIDTFLLENKVIEINIVLKEKFNELNAVVVTAGAFEASDEKKAAVLRPLDIVTTAGAAGDMYGALQTLPGATQVGNDDGLYVRGGSDYETKTIIDGLPVQNPYFSTIPDVPSRGRFAPFLFKGTVFSTGGYSAEYGQALSSAIILTSEDMPQFSSSGVSLSPIFVGGYHTHKFKNTAIGGGVNYTNLSLYDKIFKPITYEIIDNVQAADVSIFFRQKTSSTGIIKLYGQIEGSGLGVRFQDVDSLAEGITDDVHLQNRYTYWNASYKEILMKKWTLYLAVGYSNNKDSILFENINTSRGDEAIQTKLTLSNYFTEKINFKTGVEYQKIFNEQYFDVFQFEARYNYSAAFVESDIFITNDFAGRIGVRGEYTDIIDQFNLAPRISLAYKTGKNSQVSIAYGDFYQVPQTSNLYNSYPYFSNPTSLNYEKATHYIANYQIVTNERTFRIEAYYKNYTDLISYNEIQNNQFESDSAIMNGGDGYAKGIDLFYRDKKTIKNADFWISYSILDTKRKFAHYPIKTQPTFAADQVFSIVYKHYIENWNTQFGATYRYISGFPYYDPFASDLDFLKNTSPAYHNFSVNASYLTDIRGNFTVIFASVDNVFGLEQIYGYQYSTQDPGVFIEQTPPLKRTIFVGMFFSIIKPEVRKQFEENTENENTKE